MIVFLLNMKYTIRYTIYLGITGLDCRYTFLTKPTWLIDHIRGGVQTIFLFIINIIICIITTTIIIISYSCNWIGPRPHIPCGFCNITDRLHQGRSPVTKACTLGYTALSLFSISYLRKRIWEYHSEYVNMWISQSSWLDYPRDQ